MQMQEAFLRLVQGSTTVDYESRFLTRSRYDPNTAPDDRRMTQRFMPRLRQPIRDHLDTFDVRTYAKAVRRAQLVKRSQRPGTGMSSHQGFKP